MNRISTTIILQGIFRCQLNSQVQLSAAFHAAKKEKEVELMTHFARNDKNVCVLASLRMLKSVADFIY